jgi:hypothetical protein
VWEARSLGGMSEFEYEGHRIRISSRGSLPAQPVNPPLEKYEMEVDGHPYTSFMVDRADAPVVPFKGSSVHPDLPYDRDWVDRIVRYAIHEGHLE